MRVTLDSNYPLMSRNVCSDENGRFDKIFDKLMAHRIKGSQSNLTIMRNSYDTDEKIHKEYKGMNMQQMTEIVPFTCFYLRMILNWSKINLYEWLSDSWKIKSSLVSKLYSPYNRPLLQFSKEAGMFYTTWVLSENWGEVSWG